MEGSRFEELLETVYTPNPVLCILPSKSIGKVLGGYFLEKTTLKIKMLSPVFSSYDYFKELTADEIENEVLLVKIGSPSADFMKIL